MKKNKSDTKSSPCRPDSRTGDIHAEQINAAAEAYLDLWQKNLKHWATDPDALRNWITANDKKQPD